MATASFEDGQSGLPVSSRVPAGSISADQSEVLAEVQSCVEMARAVQTQVAAGERLSAARAAVDLVRAYDRVLDNIRLTPLSVREQQGARDLLGPVTELLKRYRLR